MHREQVQYGWDLPKTMFSTFHHTWHSASLRKSRNFENQYLFENIGFCAFWETRIPDSLYFQKPRFYILNIWIPDILTF